MSARGEKNLFTLDFAVYFEFDLNFPRGHAEVFKGRRSAQKWQVNKLEHLTAWLRPVSIIDDRCRS